MSIQDNGVLQIQLERKCIQKHFYYNLEVKLFVKKNLMY